MTGVYNSEAINELETFFLGRNDLVNRWGNIVSSFLALPGLRGFWPMSAFDSSGNAQDQSGHAHHLTYNGNPTYNYTGLAPYIDLDGTGDYLSRADEADLQIVGTETYVAAAVQGLTLGGWFYITRNATELLIGKANDTAGPFSIFNEAVATILFRIRNVGDAVNTDVRVSKGDVNEWKFIAGRFDPSTETKVWLNSTTNTNVAAIPASIHNGADDFFIGSTNGTNLFLGRASLCFLCAALLSDAQISSLYQQTRGVFGV